MTTILRAVCATLLSAGLLWAQEPAKPKWPDLDDETTDRARVLVEQLVDEDDDIAEAAEEELAAMGAGVAHLLFANMRRARLSRQVAAMNRVLDEVVVDEFASLVLPLTKDRSVDVRTWSVGWLARHRSEDHRKALTKAAGDDEVEVAFRASAGLVALGEIDALERVFDTCNEDWPTHAEFVGAVLPPARGDAAADWVFARMPSSDARAQVTGLRLLRSLAPEDYAARVAAFLDTEQHSVKKEAINALRVIVDGEPPLENLSVFQAIEQAKKWKARFP